MDKSTVDSVTLVFSIKNIYNLFIYKDYWTDGKVMRAVVKEIMTTSQFKWDFVGINYKPVIAKLSRNSTDSALISVTILGLQLKDLSRTDIVSSFVNELTNRRNRYFFKHFMLDESRNLTYLNITIKSNILLRKVLANYETA